jgi:hypothetical protein
MSELAVVERNSIISSYDEVERVAKAMAASGFFVDTKSVSQAVVKIMAGAELGFGPFASMNGVYIIQGRPSFGANMMAAAVKASGRYNYRVLEMSDSRCEIAFFEHGQDCGHSVFTVDDAKKAGTKNLDKYARNMLFARAMSNGVRWYCPDVTNGSAVYTPEELGAEVDGEGNVIIEAPVTVVEEVIHETIVQPTSIETESEVQLTIKEAMEVLNSKGEKYGDLDNDKLKYMSGSLFRALKSPDHTPEEVHELKRKLASIELILQDRSK